MITIKQFLKKIEFSGKFEKENILIYYFDRIKNEVKSVCYKDVKVEDDNLVVNSRLIPVNRIREIRSKGILIYKRQWGKNTK